MLWKVIFKYQFIHKLFSYGLDIALLASLPPRVVRTRGAWMPQHGPTQPQPGIGQAPMSRSPSIRRCRGMFHVLGGPGGVGIATGARLRRSAPHSPLPSAGPYPECTEAPHTAHLRHSPQVRAPRAGRGGWGGWYMSPMALNGHPIPPGRAVPVL